MPDFRHAHIDGPAIPRDPRTVLETDLELIDPEFPDMYFLDDLLARSPLRGAYEKHGAHAYSYAYAALLERCVRYGDRQLNARTGTEIRTALHQRLSHECLFGLPLPGVRQVHPGTAAAELAWSLLGTEDVSFMSKHAAIWDQFAVDGKIEGAYGHRWRRAFGRDQLDLAVDTLRRDPSNRQVYVSAWDPAADGLDPDSRALAPCPVGFSLQLLEGRINIMVHLRSSDLAVGLPYDAMCYAYLLAALAEELDVVRGRLTLALDHAHVYEHQARLLEPYVRAIRPAGCAPMPRWTIRAIETDPDGYVAAARALAAGTRQPGPIPMTAVA